MWFWHAFADITGNIIGYGLLAIPFLIAGGLLWGGVMILAHIANEAVTGPMRTVCERSRTIQLTRLCIIMAGEIALLGLMTFFAFSISVGIGVMAASGIQSVIGIGVIANVLGTITAAAALYYLFKGIWLERKNITANLSEILSK